MGFWERLSIVSIILFIVFGSKVTSAEEVAIDACEDFSSFVEVTSLEECAKPDVFTLATVSSTEDGVVEVRDTEGRIFGFGGYEEFNPVKNGDKFFVVESFDSEGNVIMTRLSSVDEVFPSNASKIDHFHGQIIFINKKDYYDDVIVLAEDNRIHRFDVNAENSQLKIGDEIRGSVFESLDSNGVSFEFTVLE